MKQYLTKTGQVLTVIQGQGLGDGIPRGQLRLVTDQTETVQRPSLIDKILTKMKYRPSRGA